MYPVVQLERPAQDELMARPYVPMDIINIIGASLIFAHLKLVLTFIRYFLSRNIFLRKYNFHSFRFLKSFEKPKLLNEIRLSLNIG